MKRLIETTEPTRVHCQPQWCRRAFRACDFHHVFFVTRPLGTLWFISYRSPALETAHHGRANEPCSAQPCRARCWLDRPHLWFRDGVNTSLWDEGSQLTLEMTMNRKYDNCGDWRVRWFGVGSVGCGGRGGRWCPWTAMSLWMLQTLIHTCLVVSEGLIPKWVNIL